MLLVVLAWWFPAGSPKGAPKVHLGGVRLGISGSVHCQQAKISCTLLESGFQMPVQDSPDGVTPSAVAAGSAITPWS